MADPVQNALLLLQSGGKQQVPQMPTQDPVGSALAQLQSKETAAAPKPLNIGVAGLPQAVKDVAGDFSPFTQEAVGAKALWDAAAMKLKTAMGGTLTPEEQAAQAANSALLESSRPAQAGAVVSSLATTPIAEAALAASPVASGLASLPILGRLFGGAVIGGTTAAATSPDNKDLGLAELAGAGGNAALGLASRVARPIIQSPAVQKLTSSGIIPTVGQALGKFGKSVEDRLTSIPIAGDLIKGAQARAVNELNSAAIQRAAPEVTDIGREGLRQAEASVNKIYDEVVPTITLKADASFVPHLETAADNPKLMLTNEQRQSVKSFLRANVGDAITNGEIPGEMAKKVDSLIGQKAASLKASSVGSEREMGQAFSDAQVEFRRQMLSGAPDQATYSKLADANQKWAQIVRLQRAVGAGKEGVFTPGQLQGAVKAEDKSVRKNRFAKGQAVMQDLSDPAVSVLGDRYPDSGTAGRAMLAMLALGGTGAGANEYFGGPRYLSALALAPLAYSRAGSRYLLGDYGIQQAIAPQIGALAPYASTALAQYLRK